MNYENIHTVEVEMTCRDHKTKVVCTIGPASDTPEMMFRMIEAGMDIARLTIRMEISPIMPM